MPMEFDTPQATVLIVAVALLILFGGAKFFAGVNVG
jgi:hypothetical protein